MSTFNRDRWAFIAPFAVFMGLLSCIPFFDGIIRMHDWNLPASSQYVVFPLQTMVCGALLWWFWPCYKLKPVVGWVFTVTIALLVLLLWVSPQAFFGFPPRVEEGFDPTIFAGNPSVYYATIALRFLRLVVIVPLLEEIFWRGFLLRDLIHPTFYEVPIGAFTWRSFAIVILAFGVAHWGKHPWPPGPDFVPALVTSALFNAVAYRTKSLSACVAAHAVTNLGLGIYIMKTGQWGFW